MKVERIPVNISWLFDEQVIEKLADGARAEDLVDIPDDVSRRLSVLADSIVQRLLGRLDVEVSEAFEHALKEWIKLWLFAFSSVWNP